MIRQGQTFNNYCVGEARSVLITLFCVMLDNTHTRTRTRARTQAHTKIQRASKKALKFVRCTESKFGKIMMSIHFLPKPSHVPDKSRALTI